MISFILLFRLLITVFRNVKTRHVEDPNSSSVTTLNNGDGSEDQVQHELKIADISVNGIFDTQDSPNIQDGSRSFRFSQGMQQSSKVKHLVKSCRENAQKVRDKSYKNIARRVDVKPELLKQKSKVPVFYSLLVYLLCQINKLRDINTYLLLVHNIIARILFSYALDTIGVESQDMITKTMDVLTNNSSFDSYKSHMLGKTNALYEFMFAWQRQTLEGEDARNFGSLLVEVDISISEAKKHHVGFVKKFMQAWSKDEPIGLLPKCPSGLQCSDVEIDRIDQEFCFLCVSKNRQVVVECCKKEIVSKRKRSLAARRYTLLKTIDGVPSEENVYKAKNIQYFTVELRLGGKTTPTCTTKTLQVAPCCLTYEIPKRSGPIDVTIELNKPDEYIKFQLQAKHIDNAIVDAKTEPLESWLDEGCARDLIGKGVLPQPGNLGELCSHYCRKSAIISEICTQICGKIRSILEENLNVARICLIYPAFKEEDENAIIFVVLLESHLDALDVEFGYHCEVLLKRDISAELQYVSEEMLHRKMTLPLAQQYKLQETISELGRQLFTEHQHLSLITASAIKSKGFLRDGCTEITNITPVIRLCVRVKGCIPISEDKFKREYNGFQTDVMEGEFIPFSGKASQRLEHLQLGCEIGRNSSLGGTLGGFAWHPKYGLCGLTCAHALLHESEMRKLVTYSKLDETNWPKEHPTYVYQPRMNEGTDVAGRLVEAIYNAASGTEIAFFTIDESRQPKNGLFPSDDADEKHNYEEGHCASQFPTDGAFWKFGFASQATTGNLLGSGTTSCRFNYAIDADFCLFNLYSLTPDFATYGDSGALVFLDGDPIRMRCVGLVEGCDNGKCVYVIPIAPILRHLSTNSLFDFRSLRALNIKRTEETME